MILDHLAQIVLITDWFHEYWKALGEDRCDFCTKEITKRQKLGYRLKFPDGISIQCHDKCLKKYQKEHPPTMRTPILYKRGDNI